MAKFAFWRILLPFLKNFLCCVPPYNDVSNILQEFWSLTLFQCILDQSMANSGAVFPPLGQSVPSILHTPQVKADCDLHSPAKGMEENVLAVSVVAPLPCLGLQFTVKFKHVWHSSTQ